MKTKDIPCFYINLDTATERRYKMEEAGKLSGFKTFKRFEAVRGSTLPLKTIELSTTLLTQAKVQLKSRRSFEDIDTHAAIGASLSHFQLYEHCLKKYPNAKYFIIFEDDCLFSSFNEHPGSLLQSIDNEILRLQKTEINWDVFLLGYMFLRDRVPIGTPPEISQVLKNPLAVQRMYTDQYAEVKSFCGMNAYIIKAEIIPKILKWAYPIETHIDAWMGLLSQMGKIKLISSPTLCISQPIWGEINHGWMHLGILNENDYWYKIIVWIFFAFVIIFIIIYLCAKWKHFYQIQNKSTMFAKTLII
jgi:GR25 family glycosyltransferase involved in LPS biosynthesis